MESKSGLLKFRLEPYKGSCRNDTASKTNSERKRGTRAEDNTQSSDKYLKLLGLKS